MHILIAGATGYIGSHLAKTLAAAGHTVHGTSRTPDRARPLDGVTTLHRWSPADEPLPAEAIDTADAIVLLTGESVLGRWTAGKKRRLRESRVTAAQNLVRGIDASPHKPSLVLGGSAVGYYGDRGDDPLDETAAHGHDFLALLTADWENAIARAGAPGTRIVHSRTGLVIGKNCTFLKPMLPIWKLGLGGRLGDGNQWWPWVHIEDLTAALRYAIETPTVTGPINIVSPGIVRQREFSKTLGRVLHRPAITWAPAIAIRLLLGDMANEVLTSKRVLPTALTNAGFTFSHPHLAPSLTDAVS